MKNRLLATTAICGLAFFAATPAFAACDNPTPTNGQTVNCSGTDNVGVAGTGSIIVNVDPGATLNVGGGVDAIAIDSGTVTVGNGATLLASGGGQGIHSTDANGLTTVTLDTNSSTTGNWGIYLDGAGDITVNSATVVGTGGTAIRTNATGGGDTTVSVTSDSTVTGNIVVAGGGTNDTFKWVNIGSNTFDTTALIGVKYQGFENFVKDSTDTLTLTGTNAQNWQFNGGTTNATVSNVNHVNLNGAQSFLLSGTGGGTYNGNITGNGDVIADNSEYSMTGNNSFTGGLTIRNASNITLQDAAAASAVSGITVDFSTLTFGIGFNNTTYDRNIAVGANDATFAIGTNNMTLSGNITGGAGHDIGKTGNGTLTLTGTNSFGNMNIAAGGAVAGSGAALGNASSSFNGSGTLQITGGTVASSIGGALAVSLDNSTATLSGTNGFTGALTLQNSAGLTVNSAAAFSGTSGVALSGGANFGYGAAMTTNRNFSVGVGGASLFTNAHDVTMSGVISGSGDLNKQSTGNLILSGNSTYSGALTVSAGRLSVNGSMGSASSTTVANGGTLGGTGTVRNVAVNSGGIVAAGNSIGTLNVTGTLVFNSGSHYAVEYDNASADNTVATGAVTINSGTILDLTGTGTAGSFAANQTYTILQGASVTGTFSTINNNLVFLDATQNNTGTALEINLARNNTYFSDVVASEEKDVATAVSALGNNDLSNAITGLTVAQAQDAMEQLSNQHGSNTSTAVTATATGVIQKIETRLGHMNGDTDKTAMLPSDPESYVAAYLEPSAGDAVFQETQFWAQALATMGRTSSTSDGPASDRQSYGMLGGVDLAFDDHGFYGLFMGYERGTVDTDSQFSSSDIDNYHLGAYAARPMNDFNISTGAAFTYHNIDTQRHIIIPGFQSSPQSETDGYTASAFVEVSKDLQFNDIDVTPFAAVTLTHSQINGYTETGGGTANLVVDDSTSTNPSTTLGSRFEKELTWGGMPMIIGASLGWQHTFGDVDPSTDMRFETGTVGFSTTGAPRARDQALIGIAAGMNIASGMNAYAGYDGALSSKAQDHSVKAGLKVDF